MDGCHHNVGLLAAQAPQRGRANLLNVRVRRQAGVRVCFPGRKGTNFICYRSVKHAMEVRDIDRKRRHTAIVRRHDHERPSHCLPQACHKQGARAFRQAGNHDAGLSAERLRGNAPEIGDIRDARKNFGYAFF